MSEFKIGDQVWLARFEGVVSSVECPACGGTGRLRVTFHDETQVSIDCANCARGYEPPTGRVTVHERKAIAYPCVVTGMEITAEGTEYHLSGGAGYHFRSRDVFSTIEGAEARGAVLAAGAGWRAGDAGSRVMNIAREAENCPALYREKTARHEGWILSLRDDGRYEIQRFDEGSWRYDPRYSQLQPPFRSDDEAQAFVARCALFSPMHHEALKLNGQRHDAAGAA